MKVKTALILCPGLGKRLNQLTLEKPKPLLEINKLTLLKAPWLNCKTEFVICTLPCLGNIIPSIPAHSQVLIIWPKFCGSLI